MKRSKIEAKIKLIDDEIKNTKKLRDFNRKNDKILITLGGITLSIIIIISYIENKVTILDVFSISVLVTSLYSLIKDSINSKNDYEHNITKLNIDKTYHQKLLEDIEIK